MGFSTKKKKVKPFLVGLEQKKGGDFMKLETKRVAITGGIVWAASLALTTLVSVGTGLFVDFLKVFVSLYPGYSVSVIGSIIGAVYGFFDVFIGVYIFAWVYRKIGK